MFFFAGGFFGLVAIAFWLFALVDAVLAPADRVRYLQKVLWVLIVLVLLDIGAVAWFIWGRPRVGARGQRDGTRSGGEAGAYGRWLFARPDTPSSPPDSWGRPAGRRDRRPIAPDDDPDFLRSLNTKPPRDED